MAQEDREIVFVGGGGEFGRTRDRMEVNVVAALLLMNIISDNIPVISNSSYQEFLFSNNHSFISSAIYLELFGKIQTSSGNIIGPDQAARL